MEGFNKMDNTQTDSLEQKKNLLIFIADDEPEVLELMEKKILSEGYRVSKAGDGTEALAKIRETDPDIIILDINMPGMNGFEVLLEVRKSPPSPKWQPVIIVSARRELEDLKKGYSLEADHYITKPCGMGDILKAIELMSVLIPQRKTNKDV